MGKTDIFQQTAMKPCHLLYYLYVNHWLQPTQIVSSFMNKHALNVTVTAQGTTMSHFLCILLLSVQSDVVCRILFLFLSISLQPSVALNLFSLNALSSLGCQNILAPFLFSVLVFVLMWTFSEQIGWALMRLWWTVSVGLVWRGPQWDNELRALAVSQICWAGSWHV